MAIHYLRVCNFRDAVEVMDFIVAFLVGGVGAITAVILAQRKNRNVMLWFILCFLFPLALLPLFALAPVPKSEGAKVSSEPNPDT